MVLVPAGTLSGRPATTHWPHAEDLAALHPDVPVDPDVLFTDDGDVLTSAGLSAGVDRQPPPARGHGGTWRQTSPPSPVARG